MIGILTYDHPHRKTQDLLHQLMARGHQALHVIAAPYVQRKNFRPIYHHRPSTAIDVSLDLLSERLGFGLTKLAISELSGFLATHAFDHLLIAGAGILPEDVARNYRIINSHPGYLPRVRGLDALKWAILSEQPIGVTTHFISDKADEGILIERREVPIFFEDTFHSVAYRQYELEIEMLATSIEKASELAISEDLSDDRYQPNRRMPHHLEVKMMHQFRKLVEKAPSHIQ